MQRASSLHGCGKVGFRPVFVMARSFPFRVTKQIWINHCGIRRTDDFNNHGLMCLAALGWCLAFFGVGPRFCLFFFPGCGLCGDWGVKGSRVSWFRGVGLDGTFEVLDAGGFEVCFFGR